MDGNRFDEITRALGTGRTRRGVLRSLGAAALGAAGLAASGGGALAGKNDKVGICHRTGSASHPWNYITVAQSAVPAHQAHGDVIAPDFQNDPANCGGCGNACTTDVTGATATCSGGSCGFACPDGQTACGGACTDTATDVDNCGACGTVCSAVDDCTPAACADGACNETSACTGFDTCGGGGTAGQCGCTADCSARICGASDTCGGTCTGDPASDNPSITLSFSPSSNPDFCNVTAHLTGFAGCTTLTGEAFSRDGSVVVDRGAKTFTTDFAGSDDAGLFSYVKSSRAALGSAFIRVDIGAVSSGYQEVVC